MPRHALRNAAIYLINIRHVIRFFATLFMSQLKLCCNLRYAVMDRNGTLITLNTSWTRIDTYYCRVHQEYDFALRLHVGDMFECETRSVMIVTNSMSNSCCLFTLNMFNIMSMYSI